MRIDETNILQRWIANYLEQGQITSPSNVPYNSSSPLYTNIK